MLYARRNRRGGGLGSTHEQRIHGRRRCLQIHVRRAEGTCPCNPTTWRCAAFHSKQLYLILEAVELLPDPIPPRRNGNRKAHVRGHGAEGDGRISRSKVRREDGRHERDLQGRWHDVEDEARQHKVDGAAASVHDALQASCLAAKVKAQVHGVKMSKEISRDEADGALRDGREYNVAQLRKGGRRYARSPVCTTEGQKWQGE